MIVILDQVTKMLAVSNITEGQPVEVLGRFLMFTLVYNQGGAMGTSFGSANYYLISSLVILVFVLWYIYKSRGVPITAIPLAFIAGGAIGNDIDRIRMGRVIDFIDVDFFDISLFGFELQRWWVFNIADIAITCAIVFLLLHLIFGDHGQKTPSSTDPQDTIADGTSSS